MIVRRGREMGSRGPSFPSAAVGRVAPGWSGRDLGGLVGVALRAVLDALCCAKVFCRRIAGYAREVGFGHLEGEEEEAGAFEVEGVVGEAADDLGEGYLEILGVGDGRDVEGCTGVGSGRRAAGGVMVEAELLAAEGGGVAKFWANSGGCP